MRKSLSLDVVSQIFQSEIVNLNISFLITLWEDRDYRSATYTGNIGIRSYTLIITSIKLETHFGGLPSVYNGMAIKKQLIGDRTG